MEDPHTLWAPKEKEKNINERYKSRGNNNNEKAISKLSSLSKSTSRHHVVIIARMVVTTEFRVFRWLRVPTTNIGLRITACILLNVSDETEAKWGCPMKCRPCNDFFSTILLCPRYWQAIGPSCSTEHEIRSTHTSLKVLISTPRSLSSLEVIRGSVLNDLPQLFPVLSST